MQNNLIQLQYLLNKGDQLESFRSVLSKEYVEQWKQGFLSNKELNHYILGNRMSTQILMTNIFKYLRSKAKYIPNKTLYSIIFNKRYSYNSVMDVNERYKTGDVTICPICGADLVHKSNQLDQGYTENWVECPYGCEFEF